MEILGFQIIDMIIIGLILFLAIRGLVNGFSTELFNFFALIGGIALASRTHNIVGKFLINQNILPDVSSDFQKLIGFAVVLVGMVILFNIFSSIRNHFRESEPTFFSRLLGYIISVSRYIFIFSLIAYGIHHADFLRENFSSKYENSKLFKPMSKIGEKLLGIEEESANTSETSIPTENNESKEENLSTDISRVSVTDHNLSTDIEHNNSSEQ